MIWQNKTQNQWLRWPLWSLQLHIMPQIRSPASHKAVQGTSSNNNGWIKVSDKAQKHSNAPKYEEKIATIYSRYINHGGKKDQDFQEALPWQSVSRFKKNSRAALFSLSGSMLALAVSCWFMPCQLKIDSKRIYAAWAQRKTTNHVINIQSFSGFWAHWHCHA